MKEKNDVKRDRASDVSMSGREAALGARAALGRLGTSWTAGGAGRRSGVSVVLFGGSWASLASPVEV